MKKLKVVKLLGVASCCMVVAVSAAKADAIALSDSDLDRVTAGLEAPPPLIELPPAFAGQFDTLPGLFDPPPPPPPPPAPETPTVPLPDVRGLPGEFLGAILQLILSGGLR